MKTRINVMMMAVFNLLLGSIFLGSCLHVEKKGKASGADTVCLSVSQAQLSSDLKLEGEGAEASILDWHHSKQFISWNVKLKPGNYQLFVRYSQPYAGSAVTIGADGEELAVLFPKTEVGWKTWQAGVLHIAHEGEHQLVLQGIQLGMKRDEKGLLRANAPLPQLQGIQLVPTTEKATSQPAGIRTDFKGTKLFNGTDFTGWIGNDGGKGMNYFRIEAGSIVGGTMDKPMKQNQFILTEKVYKDFELRLKYRVNATDESYNGGVQVRSVPCQLPEMTFEMVGYQVDIISWRRGVLYDEQRRRDFLGLQLEPTKEPRPASEWNEYIIRCEGPRVRVWLNGVKTTDYIEPYVETPLDDIGIIPQEGVIALQIHEGKACELWYKDIEIEELRESD